MTTEASSSGRRFPFEFDRRYRHLAVPFGITRARAWVRVGAGRLEARYGPWRVVTPMANVEGAELSGPFSMLRTAGPARLSVTDRGLTFASNANLGLCIRFREPVPGIDPTGTLRHPALTVTVTDVEGLRHAIEAAT